MQKGEGLIRNSASSSDSAVRAFSPPDRQLHRLVLLAGWLGRDVDARLQGVVFVHQIEAGGAAAEEVREGLGEDRVDLLEGVHEAFGAGGVDLADGGVQGAQGLDQVLALGGEKGRAFLELVELPEGEQVDRSEALDLGAQALDRLAQGLGLVLGVGLGLQKFFNGETEFLGGVFAETLPIRLGAGLFDLDRVQHVALGLVRLAALADLLLERWRPGPS